MTDAKSFYGVATVGTKGQIVIPADARAELALKEGDKMVVLKGPREGSLIIFKVDSIDIFKEKVQERSQQE
jgi:AbrB family looped-hinge helix DNA binding protein